MTTELTTLASLTNLPTTQTQVDLSQYGSGGDFLGRLQLVNSQSKYVGLRKIEAGHYGIPGADDSIQDLGDTVDAVVLAVRFKAMDLSGETPVAVFDPDDPLYQDIVERAAVKDSGCMFGPSFLVFERTSARFLEFYLGNKSGRYIAGSMGEFLPVSTDQAAQLGISQRPPKACTLGTQFIERPRQAWYAPTVGRCSTPFDNLPGIEAIVAEVEKFVNETSSDSAPELVAGSEGRTR